MKSLYSTGKDSITIPSVHIPVTVVDPIAFRGVSTDSVELILQFCILLEYITYGNHGVGNGLIFESIVSGYFGRIRMDLRLLEPVFVRIHLSF